MVRIFLTSSHLSSVAAALIAKKLSNEGDKNFLLIDHYGKKKSLVELINTTTEIFLWDDILDFSYHLDNSIDLNPGIKKKILRKIKTFPVISRIYELLLKRHSKNYVEEMSIVLRDRFSAINLSSCDELYLLTQTALNETLFNVFPAARTVYYEHGLGDYYYYHQKKLKGDFIGFFGDEFKTYTNFNNIESLSSALEFQSALGKYHSFVTTQLGHLKGKKCAFFLMDALEGYNPPISFWTDYLEVALNKAALPDDCILLVKPHPNQSNGVMEITSKWLKEKNIEHVFLSDAVFVSLSVEVIFSYLEQETICLISTFSSAIFYLSKFYPSACRYLLMYDFVEPYTVNAPLQYKEHFHGLRVYIDRVFIKANIERVGD